MAEPTIVLGTMTFGWAQSSHPMDDAAAAAQLDYFTSKGFNEIDTARMHAAGLLTQRAQEGGGEGAIGPLPGASL